MRNNTKILKNKIFIKYLMQYVIPARYQESIPIYYLLRPSHIS